jgi:hypothetical protein
VISQRQSNYVQKAARNILEELASAGKGGRNNALNKAAMALARFIPGGYLSSSEAESSLMSVASSMGLKQIEARSTIKQGMKAGMMSPAELSWLQDDERQSEGIKMPTVIVKQHEDESIEPPPESARGMLLGAWAVIGSWAPIKPSGDLKQFMKTRKLRWRDIISAGCCELDDSGFQWFRDHLWCLDALGDNALAEELGWRSEYGSSWPGFIEPGLLVPVWSQAWPKAPVAYRWRPWSEKRRQKTKSWSMYGATRWRRVPMITSPALRMEQANAVIVEGEPDFLSLHLHLAGAGYQCIGLPGASWPGQWDDILSGTSRVIVATDADDAGDQVATKIALACSRLGIEFARRRPSGGSKDWSDLIQAGAGTPEQVCSELIKR